MAERQAHGGCVFVVIPALRMGGGEISLLRLAAEFARGGLRCVLVVYSSAGAELPVPAGVELLDLKAPTTRGAVRALARALRERRPDWLLSAFPHTNIAAVTATMLSRSGVQCVVSEHAPLSRQIQGQANLRYRVLPPIVRWAYRRAAAVVAVSKGVAEDLKAMIGPDLRLSIIGNPVIGEADLPYIDGASAAQPAPEPVHPWLLDPTLRTVLTVSRISVEKDVPTLVNAFAALHRVRADTRLVIAGDGPDLPRVRTLVTQRGLEDSVAFVGRVARPVAWMRHADVFALASQYEGFGNVLVEAMAAGAPVVATDCPVGPREILDGGTRGRLVPVGDADAMSEAMTMALDEGAAPPSARAFALRFTDAASGSQYRQLFESLSQHRA